MDHINGNSTNPHLHNALLKYGLSHYAFVILEYCLSSDLLKREQHFLDLLDTLPKTLCYNIARFAEAPFTGLTHTPETAPKSQRQCLEPIILIMVKFLQMLFRVELTILCMDVTG